ncbi:hypothetical protein HUG17_4064 [Dermatophagoides farinae]|uniref:Cadherin domain-containing protein n=1 Tax=Dermatophagoides farinae TaxID=6954 RepID=A0A9D4NVY8_DERFA|nr:hypothetical protein HUG17_4064 [Dermatophagoides farinae]
MPTAETTSTSNMQMMKNNDKMAASAAAAIINQRVVKDTQKMATGHHQIFHHNQRKRNRKKSLPMGNNRQKMLQSSSTVIKSNGQLSLLKSSKSMRNSNATQINHVKSKINKSGDEYDYDDGENDDDDNDSNESSTSIPSISQQSIKQPVYEVIVNEEETDLPKKLFQVKALMINDSNGSISTTTINQRKSGGSFAGGLMFILSGNGVDYEHPEQSKFAINTITGELFLIAPLDRDPPDGREQYRLTIQAEDERSEKINGSVLVIVRVRDINDNQPYFEQHEYHAQVRENLGTGIDVIRLQAIDRDPDSIIRYSIEVNRVNQDGELIFDIDELSGLVSTAVCCLDRESIGEYTIKICATDHAINGDQQTYHWSNNNNQQQQQQSSSLNQSSSSSCTNVKINVTDDNDEPPQFLRDYFYLTFLGASSSGIGSKHLSGINQLYAQRILLNQTIIDQDLPETNHFICRLDVQLRFPIQVPKLLLQIKSSTIDSNNNNNNETTSTTTTTTTMNVETLFWMFIKNETDSMMTNDKMDAKNRSTDNHHYHHYGVGHYTNLNKYFQCFISRMGAIRIQISEKFSRKYFYQTLIQEFEHYRQKLWNRFRQRYGDEFPHNLLHLKELIQLSEYVDIFIGISVSDLGYFDIPSTISSSSSSSSAALAVASIQQQQQQQQQIQRQQQLQHDISGLLDTHVIHAELVIKLSMEAPYDLSNESDNPDDRTGDNDDDDDDKNGGKWNQIINKQRISPYDDSDELSIINNNKIDTSSSLLKFNESNGNGIDGGIDSRKNGGRINTFFHHFYQSTISWNSNHWFSTLLFGGFSILLLMSIIFMFLKRKTRIIHTRAKHRHRTFSNQQFDDDSINSNNNVEQIMIDGDENGNNHHDDNDDIHGHTLSPLRKSPIECPSFYQQNSQQQQQHLYYSQINNDPISSSTPTTITTNGSSSALIIDNNHLTHHHHHHNHHYYDNSTTAATTGHLVLLNDHQQQETMSEATTTSATTTTSNGQSKSISPFSIGNTNVDYSDHHHHHHLMTMATINHPSTSFQSNSHHQHNSYALYDLAQITTAATAAQPLSQMPPSLSAIPLSSSTTTTTTIPEEELIEMKSLMITANDLQNHHHHHHQYYSGHTSLSSMNNDVVVDDNDNNMPTITGSGTNLLLIQHQHQQPTKFS